MPEHPDRLREITPELMADLVASPGMRIASQLKFVGPLHGKSYLVDAEPFRQPRPCSVLRSTILLPMELQRSKDLTLMDLRPGKNFLVKMLKLHLRETEEVCEN